MKQIIKSVWKNLCSKSSNFTGLLKKIWTLSKKIAKVIAVIESLAWLLQKLFDAKPL